MSSFCLFDAAQTLFFFTSFNLLIHLWETWITLHPFTGDYSKKRKKRNCWFTELLHRSHRCTWTAELPSLSNFPHAIDCAPGSAHCPAETLAPKCQRDKNWQVTPKMRLLTFQNTSAILGHDPGFMTHFPLWTVEIFKDCRRRGRNEERELR